MQQIPHDRYALVYVHSTIYDHRSRSKRSNFVDQPNQVLNPNNPKSCNANRFNRKKWRDWMRYLSRSNPFLFGHQIGGNAERRHQRGFGVLAACFCLCCVRERGPAPSLYMPLLRQRGWRDWSRANILGVTEGHSRCACMGLCRAMEPGATPIAPRALA